MGSVFISVMQKAYDRKKYCASNLTGIEICAFHLIAVCIFLVLDLLNASVVVIISLHIYGISSANKQIIGCETLTRILILTAGGW